MFMLNKTILYHSLFQLYGERIHFVSQAKKARFIIPNRHVYTAHWNKEAGCTLYFVNVFLYCK